MTDERLERLLADLLADTAPATAPDRLAPETLRAARRVRRWPRWLALVKEPPMRISSRVAVGSPVVRIAYAAVLLLLLAVLATGTVVGAASLLPGPATIVVAPGGTGDYTTITEAVTVARDGDTVLVRPGTYTESVLIDKDITLDGDGDVGTVVIEFAADGPTTDAYGSQVPYGLMLVDTSATVRDLTIIGPRVGRVIEINGGAPTLEALTGDIVGAYGGRPQSALGIRGASTALIRDVRFSDTVQIWAGARPTIEDSEFTCFVAISDAGTSPIIRHTSFRDECGNALLFVEGGATPTIEDNDLTFTATPIEPGIVVEDAGSAPVDPW